MTFRPLSRFDKSPCQSAKQLLLHPKASPLSLMNKLFTSWFLLCVCFALCAGQTTPATDKTFEQLLIKVLEPLQRKQLPPYEAGTEVVVQEFQDGKPYGAELKSVLKTNAAYYSGADLMPNALPGSTSNAFEAIKSCPTTLQIDGHTVPTILRTLAFNIWGPEENSGTATTRQWLAAANPRIVLRQEFAPQGAENKCEQGSTLQWWAVTAIGIRKRIGDVEYECAELTERNDFVGGYVITKIYLSPQAPTFWVESVKNFYTIAKGQTEPKFSFVRTMRVMSIKPPSETRPPSN